MAETNNRDFKGVWISKEIWLDKRLNALEKVILAEIDSLDDEAGCYASNEYLAEFCQCSSSKVSGAISKLKQLGYIYEKSFDGRQRILKSRLTKNERQTTKIYKADCENLKDNNISNNKDIKDIIDYLNSATSSNYRYQSKATQRLIKARLNEGYTLDDFKAVIDKKVEEWKDDPKMAQYLRPETLFGTKFESYLNAPKKTAKISKDAFLEDEHNHSKEELESAFMKF